MTREEAKRELLFAKREVMADSYIDKAYDMAIKALEQPEPCEDKLKEIAEALSEKMCHMNTCLNERDIILGYLGVKRPSETHCNSDCRNEKCESYHYVTKKLPSAQPEIIRCKDCKQFRRWLNTDICFCDITEAEMSDDDFCSRAERREG